MRALGPADLLELWETCLGMHPLDRSALLCAWARPHLPADGIADLPLGTVTETLLELRAVSFGARIASHVDCPHCGERLALSLETDQLLGVSPRAEVSPTVEVASSWVRALGLRDLAAVAHERDPERAARLLFKRCVRDRGDTAEIIPNPDLRAVEDALEALDPNADLALAARCECCGEDLTVALDPGVLLWDEVDARARALLGEVHLLARAYGWTEGEILGLGAARRAAYLGLVNG
jgi:hypothetical protein